MGRNPGGDCDPAGLWVQQGCVGAGRCQARATAHITQVRLGAQAPTLTPVPLRGPPDFSACPCSPELPMPHLCPRREPSPHRGPACLPCHQLRPGTCGGPWCQACVTRGTSLTYPQQRQSYLEPTAGQAASPNRPLLLPTHREPHTSQGSDTLWSPASGPSFRNGCWEFAAIPIPKAGLGC